jgi:hypothetical protein
MQLKRNKKGSALDLIWIGVILVFFSIVLILGFYIGGEINTKFQSHTDIPSEGKVASAQLVSNYPAVYDNMFLFFMVGISIVTLVLAALVRIHPVFIPLFIIAWIFISFIGGIFSNIFQALAENPDLAASANQLTFTSTIMSYLPMIIGIIGMILMVVMYKTWKVNQL